MLFRSLGNSKALNALFNGVDKNMLRLIKQFTMAKEALEILKTPHEGTLKDYTSGFPSWLGSPQSRCVCHRTESTNSLCLLLSCHLPLCILCLFACCLNIRHNICFLRAWCWNIS